MYEKANNIILTGIPRSGTTLTCFLLSQKENVVALNEPIAAGRFRSSQEALSGTAGFFNDTRISILERGMAMAKAVNGKMTDNHFALVNGKREKLISKEEIKIDKNLVKDFTLVVKHNALFTVLLDDLMKNYPVYAIVRNPISVLGSWNSLDLPVSKGRVRVTKHLLPEFAEKLEGISDVHDRQLFILDWYFKSYRKLEQGRVIKYEAIIESDGGELNAIQPGAINFQKKLESKNKSKLYDQEIMKKLAIKLLNQDHGCWDYYRREDIEKQLAVL